MSTVPVVALVTVTHNSELVLPDFLHSVRAQRDVDVRLYAVDSGSTDTTVDMLRGDLAVHRLVVNEQNVGIALGNNQGVLAALADGADWVLLINNDTVFGPGLVARLVRTASERGLDLVSPLIAAAEPEGTIWYAGGTLSPTAFVARHNLEGQSLEYAPKTLVRTEYGSACALLVRPVVFQAAGLMRPELFVYFDDVDFAVRVKRAGFEYWLEPEAKLLHKASSLTGGKQSRFTLEWTARNWPLTVRLNQRGARRLLGLAFIQAWIVARCLVRRDSGAVFRLRERQFVVALRTEISAPVPEAIPRAAVASEA